MSNTNTYQLTSLQRKYLSDLSKNLKKAKTYTPEQVNIMVQQYQVAPNADLLRELFISQSCLIYDQAKAFYKRISKGKWDLDDIVATANEIFIRMLDKYSDSRGSTFSSFIRNILPKYLLNEYKLVCGIIRTPVNKLSMILKHKKNLEIFVGKFGRMPYQGEALEIEGEEEYIFDYRHTFYVEDDSSLPNNTDLVVQPSLGSESYAMFDEIRQRFGERIYQIVYLHLAEGRSFTEINTLLLPQNEEEFKYLAKVNTTTVKMDEKTFQVRYNPKAQYLEYAVLDTDDSLIETSAKKITLALNGNLKMVELNPKGLYKKSTSIKAIYENTLKILRTEYV